ncbi:hypothetical protein LVISKB_1856 [Levilactobacillus brevis KB290]|uniref:Uncharacterized protein n=1 Tax=Levilactobacillus brevis KB290 TaxID=1001583 RepID=M5B1A8_LEVBR|nr:hypothetical protein LVISKB_1856 [Levilactobacillus brevis KB290]
MEMPFVSSIFKSPVIVAIPLAESTLLIPSMMFLVKMCFILKFVCRIILFFKEM